MRALAWLLLLPSLLAGGCSGDRNRLEPYSDRTAAAAAAAEQAPGELPLPPDAGLDECLRYAELRNPGVQAARARWQAAKERVPQMRSLPDPQLMYEISDAESSREQMLTLGQAIPWPGKLAIQGSLAEKEAQAEEHRYEAARLALAYRVKNAWYECWYLGRAIEVARENAELSRGVEETARARYRTAAAEFADAIKAQVELARAEDMVLELEAMKSPTVARLNAELDRPAEEPRPLPRKPPAEERLTLSDAQIQSRIEQASPELAAMDSEVAAARESLALAKRAPIPDLMLKAGPTIMEQNGMGRETGVQVGVGISIPLWFGKYRAMRREADAKLIAAGLSRRDAGNRLAADAEMALFALRDAERKASLYRDAILPRAEQAMDAALASYKAGKVPFVEMIDAQRMLVEFRLQYARALAGRAQRMAELEMLAGRELPKESAPPAQENAQETKP